MVYVIKHASIHEKGTFSLLDVLKSVKDNSNFYKAGAVALFISVVRGETSSGETVGKLELEAYEEEANEVLSNICEELRKKRGVVGVQFHHFIGQFDVGKDIVYVLVAGAHRQDVFPILEEAVERFKKEIPIFKIEYV